MLKALGSILGFATSRTRRLAPRLDGACEQMGSKLCVSSLVLGAATAEGSQTF